MINYGARNQATVKNDANKNPENKKRFRGNSNQTRVSLYPSFIQTITVGPGFPPDHALVRSRAIPPIGNSHAINLLHLRLRAVQVSKSYMCHPAPKVDI
jgi:hypothetical protein